MKQTLNRLFSCLCMANLLIVPAFAQFQPTQAELKQLNWQTLNLAQSQTVDLQQLTQTYIKGVVGSVVAYKVPANQGVLNIDVQSRVIANRYVFVPNVLVLDSQFNPALHYPAKQFQFVEERGLQSAQFKATFHLTPTSNQDFIYLLIYTTEKDLQTITTVTHPAKLLAKAKGNQPPAIADLTVQHSTKGQVVVEVEGIQSSQFVGMNSVLFEQKVSQPITIPNGEKTVKIAKTTQSVEQSTEDYFNQAVRKALKNADLNQAMNLVNEAEKLGLTEPRQIFLKQVAVKK